MLYSCSTALAYLSEVARLDEVCDPLGGSLPLWQTELHLQHSMREACDVCAPNWQVRISVPPAKPSSDVTCGDDGSAA